MTGSSEFTHRSVIGCVFIEWKAAAGNFMIPLTGVAEEDMLTMRLVFHLCVFRSRGDGVL